LETLLLDQILKRRFKETRASTENLCNCLNPEDTAIQPIDFVSPPKWHLAHTTWFFEEFVLTKYKANYKVFDKDFSYYFNSYYNNVGDRVLRPNRGLMTRPVLKEILDYRSYVTKQLSEFISNEIPKEIKDIVEIGLQHEQQHQELLVYDIKYILGHQPSFSSIDCNVNLKTEINEGRFVSVDEGVYEIGHKGSDFCFDNELGLHKVYLNDYEISESLVTNKDYLEFIEDGGYSNFNLWHADGWEYIKSNEIEAPMYWNKSNHGFKVYTLNGLGDLDLNKPLNHVSFYEAAAFAQWKGMRLPTEFEWEVASYKLNYGQLWEWTNSAYLPYPNFKTAEGALGEYNGKFMINQMVLRGASVATANGHSRPTYRNFFHPNMRWQFAGIRLAR